MNQFYAGGLKFSCQKCSGCCRHESGFVYISKNDFKRLIQRFSLSSEVFVERYCRWILLPDTSEVLCLKEKENFDCILWDKGCIAYESRPVQCSTYPFWQRLLVNEKRWIEEGSRCPGINQGKLYAAEEITEALTEREKNSPITRADFLINAEKKQCIQQKKYSCEGKI